MNHLPWERALVRGWDTDNLIKNDRRENSRSASSTFEPYDWFTESLKMNISSGTFSMSKNTTATLSISPCFHSKSSFLWKGSKHWQVFVKQFYTHGNWNTSCKPFQWKVEALIQTYGYNSWVEDAKLYGQPNSNISSSQRHLQKIWQIVTRW